MSSDTVDIKNILIKVFLCFLLIISFYFISKTSNIYIEYGKCEYPIDFEIKHNLEECYLTIHNFISFNSTLIENVQNESKMKHFNNNNTQNFKTYIYSYTKPFLIELIQNRTDNCLCYN